MSPRVPGFFFSARQAHVLNYLIATRKIVALILTPSAT
jgi:hypothetical protein